MGFQTKIQWCDHTFNPWIGCSKLMDMSGDAWLAEYDGDDERDAGWCSACHTPIGDGSCNGCIAAACAEAEWQDRFIENDYDDDV